MVAKDQVEAAQNADIAPSTSLDLPLLVMFVAIAPVHEETSWAANP